MKSDLKKCSQLLLGNLWHIHQSHFEKPKFEEVVGGAIAVGKDGRILACGKATDVRKKFKADNEYQFGKSVLLPGFIDTHIHFPQMHRVGCYGESLLGWLEKYIFPEEEKMSKSGVAAKFAPLFFRELFQNGTTTSLVFSNSDLATTESVFSAAKVLGARSIVGKSSMDRLGPKSILREPSRDEAETEKLIEQWHGHDGRLYYALTPRFSPACSPKMLKMLGQLSEKHSSVRIQTHFAESEEELKLVKKTFPSFRDYLATYEEYGLIHSRTVLAHAIFPNPSEVVRIQKSGAHVSHCPTSNLFLGSGLYPLDRFSKKKIVTSVGTDVGAGTSFSIWSTLAAAYQVQRLRGFDITPTQLLYMATLSGAKALGMETQIGNFEVGKFADIQVLNWGKSPILKNTVESFETAPERFFACLFQFEKSLITDVFVQGRKVI